MTESRVVVLNQNQAFVVINMRYYENTVLKIHTGGESPYLYIGNSETGKPIHLSTLDKLINANMIVTDTINPNDGTTFKLTELGKTAVLKIQEQAK